MTTYFKYRGLVEGFYGRPWSLEERVSSLRFLGKHGYNIYYYAPKNDPYHRNRWKEPYPPRQAADFRKLAAEAKKNGLLFSFAISPGLSIRYSSDDDVKLLLEKMVKVRELGATAFSLFLDDISPNLAHEEDKARFKDLATAHAYLTNCLYRELKKKGMGAHFTMCPTFYCGDPDTPYLKRLGARLDRAIQVFWTGPEVCSHHLSTEQTRAVSRSLRRKVLYWDNYPVNDSVMCFEPHLGPYANRDREMHRYCSGVISNPSLQAEAAKIPLYTIGEYLRDPYSYDAASSWDKALKLVAGPGSYRAFRRFADHCWKSCLYKEEASNFKRELKERVYFHGFVFDNEAGARVVKYVAELKRDGRSLLARSSNPKLVRECRPWIKKWLSLLELFAECVRLLCERRNGKENKARQLEKRIEKGLLRMHKDFHSVSDYGLVEEIQRLRVYAEVVKKRTIH